MTRTRLLHVSKFPSSPSGVALYADRFDRVMARLGRVERLVAPADPRASQRLVAALRGFGRGWRISPDTVVHVELSGRALFELYAALGRAVRRRDARLVVTCHDAPSVAGSVMMFTALDRRGLRRLGVALSRRLGEPVQRWLLGRCDVVLALTVEGARALGETYGRQVDQLPHVVDEDGRGGKDPLVFVPGYVSESGRIADVVRAVASANATGDEPWTVLVGACPDEVTVTVRNALTEGQHSLVRFTGYVDEEALLDAYQRARVVVRLTTRAPATNRLAASGPLCWAVAHGCVCVTDDDRAGARELESWGLVTRTAEPAEALPDMLRAWRAEEPARIRSEAMRRMGVDVVAEQYAELLSGLSTKRATASA